MSILDVKNKLDKLINRARDIPTLPSVVLQVNRVLRDDTATIERVGETIERDPALTSKILRLANSSYYGLSYHIDTLAKAITVLGFNTVRNLAVTISLFKIFDKSIPFSLDFKGLWQHSLGCAIASKALTNKKKDPILQEKTFIYGMLHDIGNLIISENLPAEMGMIMERLGRNKTLTLYEVEKEILSFTHSDVGAFVAERWHFPPELTDTIRLHHNPEIAKKHHETVYAVYAGNQIAKALKLGKSISEKVENINPRTWEILGLLEQDLSTLLLEIKTDFDGIINSWDLD